MSIVRSRGAGSLMFVTTMLLAAGPAAFSLAAQQPIRITCGNARTNYTASDGSVWLTDRYFTGGDGGYATETIANTSETYLYRTTRYGLYGNFSYNIPAPNGSYKLTLKFAEWRYWNRGDRVFHVSVNGRRVLSNFDILAEVPARAALDKEFWVEATDGAVRIDFQGVVNYGTVSALMLEPSHVTISVNPAEVSLTAGQTQQFTATVEGTGNTAVTWSASPGSITPSGLYTAPAVISAPGVATVAASSVADPSRTASARVELKTPVLLSVHPTSAAVTSGLTLQLASEVKGTSDTRVTWTATAGSISETGLFTAPLVTAPTVVTITATSVADPSVTALAQITVNPVTATGPVYLEVGGQVVIEAENGQIVDREHRWVPNTSRAGYSGRAALTALPNSGVSLASGYTGTSPELRYNVKFSRPGTYYVWVRCYSTGPADDSINVALDGIPTPSGEALSQFPAREWAWSGHQMDYTGRAMLEVPNAGVHVVNVWMREDGFTLDKLLLTTSADFTPTGTGPEESPVDTGGPVLSLSTANLSFASLGGAAPEPQQVEVINPGSGELSWSAASDAPWLAVSPSSGTGNATIAVAVNPAGMASGNYTGKLTVSAQAAGSPKVVEVNLSISGVVLPELRVSPLSLNFSGTAGGTAPAPRSLSITEAGGGHLSWTAVDAHSWLSLSAASGTAPSSVEVRVDTAGLAPGTHHAAITVTSAGAAGSPRTVNVTLTLEAPEDPPLPSTGNQWYVGPNGSPTGDGSKSRPWDLATALAGPKAVEPGDTIWVRGGTYGNNGKYTDSRLAGAPGAPIVVRAYPGERATVRGGIATYSPYTWYWGLEVTNTGTSRTSSGPPECFVTYENSVGVRIINMILHDCTQGIGFWRHATGETEAHGNLIYYNGFQNGSADRGHGHGIYTQNLAGNPRLLTDNIIFDQFGLGIQAYGSGEAPVEEITAEGNIVFNNGSLSHDSKLVDNILFAGGRFLDKITLRGNYTWHDPERSRGYSRLGWSWSSANGTLVSTGNYWIGGGPTLEVWNWNRATFTGNTVYADSGLEVLLRTLSGQSLSGYAWDQNRYYGSGKFNYAAKGCSFSSWKAATGKDGHSTYSSAAPSGVWVFVRPNKYEAGRGHIVVYNWDRRSAVDADVSGVLKIGAEYEVRDAQNFFGPPVAAGTFHGGTIAVPMTSTAKARPVGNVPVIPEHTGIRFGAFVILPR